jgi:hypothetical protein
MNTASARDGKEMSTTVDRCSHLDKNNISRDMSNMYAASAGDQVVLHHMYTLCAAPAGVTPFMQHLLAQRDWIKLCCILECC